MRAVLLTLLVLSAGGCAEKPEPRVVTVAPPAADDVPDTRSEPGPEFHGYECTDDCSGHEAGYAWAERNEIEDADDCDGRSQSFIEGCVAYVEEGE